MPQPDAPEVKESVEYAEQPYYKTLYGHQEVCLGLKFSKSGTRLHSWDTLNKITTTGWPNVFSNDSQLLEHTKEITHVAPMPEDQIASLSGDLKNQTLIVSTWDGQVVRKSTNVQDVIGLTHSVKDGILFIKSDGSVTNETGQAIELGVTEGKTIVFASNTDYAIGVDFDRLTGKV